MFVMFAYTVICRCEFNEPIRTMCIGPSIPPCSCSQTSCEVINFIYFHALQKIYNIYLYILIIISVTYLTLALVMFVGWILMVMAVLMKHYNALKMFALRYDCKL